MNCESVRFSIIVPVYNASLFLRDAIESVLAQRFSRYELILVNDGSTDDSLAICREASRRKPSHVTVLDEENRGPFEARKTGIRASKGEYVLFLDSDDMLRGDALEVLDRYIEKDAIDIIAFRGCRNESYEWDASSEAFHLFPFQGYGALEQAREALITTDLSNNLWSKCVRRNCLDSYAASDERNLIMAEDKLACAYILGCARKLRQIDDVLYFYRKNDDGTTNGDRAQKRFDDLCDVAHELSERTRGWAIDNAEQKIHALLLSQICLEVKALIAAPRNDVENRDEAIEHIRQSSIIDDPLFRAALDAAKPHKKVLIMLVKHFPYMLRMYMPLYSRVVKAVNDRGFKRRTP